MSDSDPERPPVRRPRKTPEERGAVGWWAYRTMVALSLSDLQIAARVGVSAPTIRKFMGSPEGELGAESRKALLAYYREVATKSQTPIDEPPTGFIVGSAGLEANGPSGLSPYLARIDSLVAELQADRKLIAQLIELVAPKPPPYDREEERADVRAGEEAAARERRETTSKRRKSDPAHRPSDSPPTVREAGAG